MRKPVRARGNKSRPNVRGILRANAREPSFGKRTKPPGGFFKRLFKLVLAQISWRRPMLLMTLCLVLIAAIAALLASGVIGRTIHNTDAVMSAFIADAGFGISQVHFTGNVRTPPETVLAALGMKSGQSIFTADLPSARMRLLQLPWVAEAEVRRRYPDDIGVLVVEKLPYARWQSKNGLYVVERSGGLITDKDLAPFARLPLLVGDDAPKQAAEFVDAVAQHRAIRARVYAYQYQSERRWNLILDDAVVVKLPETGWRKQLDALEHLIIDEGILERDVTEIDLRSPTHYFFIRKGGAEKKVERGSAI